MTRPAAGRAGDNPVRYRIVVRGELRTTAAGPLEGLLVQAGDGLSVITGQIIDQSQLLGVVDWLGGRGIEIVSLSAEDGPGEAEELSAFDLAGSMRRVRAARVDVTGQSPLRGS